MSTTALPPVLDVCCGPRSMWFNKKDPRAMFVDRRCEEHEKPRKCRKNITRIEIKPDMQADFTNLPFPDESFSMVVMDGFITREIVDKAKKIMESPEIREKMVNRNYDIAMRHYSYIGLRKYLNGLVTDFFGAE